MRGSGLKLKAPRGINPAPQGPPVSAPGDDRRPFALNPGRGRAQKCLIAVLLWMRMPREPLNGEIDDIERRAHIVVHFAAIEEMPDDAEVPRD
jgi:hypothetical protein